MDCLNLDSLTQNCLQNVKVYAGDQWTILIKFDYDGYSYFKLYGGDSSGVFDNFTIIVKSKVELSNDRRTNDLMVITSINTYSKCVRVNDNQEKIMPLMYIIRLFKESIQYYMLQNNTLSLILISYL